MVQVPAASSVAVEADTVQMVGVVEAKATGRPELDVAANARVELALCDEIAPKVIVCGVVPWSELVPLRIILCAVYVGAVALRELSVTTSVPLSVPVVVGAKVMGNKQDCPAARVPAVEDPALTTGHEDVPLLFRVKFPAMFGLFPLLGTGRFSAEVPKFSKVIVCGLSLLVEPTTVAAKVRLGASAKSSFNTEVL